MKQQPQQLICKREVFHHKIRHNQRREEIKASRYKFILENASECQRLRNVDCFMCRQNIKSQTNFFKLQNQIKDVFVYAMSNQSTHIFDILGDLGIQKLINIGEWAMGCSPKNQAEKEIVVGYQTKIMWIILKYSEQKTDNLIQMQTQGFFDKCFKSQSIQCMNLGLQIIDKLACNLHFIRSFVSSSPFTTLVQRQQCFKSLDLATFCRSIFPQLGISNYNQNIRKLIKILIQRLEERQQDDSTILQIQYALMSIFNSSLKSEYSVLIDNFRNYEIACIWLLSKDNLQKVKQELHSIIFLKLKQLYFQQFEAQQFNLLLLRLFETYLVPLCQKMMTSTTITKILILQVLQNACANCDLVSRIVNSSNVFEILLDFSRKQGFNVRKSALMCICNLVLAGEQEDIANTKIRILDSIAFSLSEYCDHQLNIILLKALINILDSKQFIESESSLQSSQLIRFNLMDGEGKLQKLLESGAPKIVNLVDKIFDKYYKQ